MANFWQENEDRAVLELAGKPGGCEAVAAELGRKPRAVWARARKLGVKLPKPKDAPAGPRRFPKVGAEAFVVTGVKWLRCLV